jgi:hypothetical protein
MTVFVLYFFKSYREGQAEEAKMNIVVGTPKVPSLKPQTVEEVVLFYKRSLYGKFKSFSPGKQQEISLDPDLPSLGYPNAESLHSGRIALRKGIERNGISMIGTF